MRDIFTVMKFTMKDLIGRKSFRISTIIILVLIVVGFNIPNIINDIDDGSSSDKVLIIDRDNIYEGIIEAEEDDKIQITTDNLSNDEIKQKINDEEFKLAVIPEREDSAHLTFHYIGKNKISTDSDELNDILMYLKTLYQHLQIEKLNLSEATQNAIEPSIGTTLEYSDDQEIGGDISVMMLLSCILFFAIYFCAFQVSSSITTEKTSKIMETLVTSTSPRNIVVGKTLGIGFVGLFQVILFGLTAIISADSFLDPATFTAIFNFSNFSQFTAIVTLIYFLLGYFVYAFLYAVTGSTVSKPEDIQSANTPVVILTMVSFYLAYFTLFDPTGELNVFAALFPFSSAFCMPLRMIMGIASGWEIILSIVILIVTYIVVAHIAIRIYSNTILNYGNKMSWKNVLKLYKEK